jgi:hypothetical protein
MNFRRFFYVLGQASLHFIVWMGILAIFVMIPAYLIGRAIVEVLR